MADTPDARRRFALAPPRPALDSDRATDFELLFDLVYVFAVTQVTSYIARVQTPRAVLQGLLILAMLWLTWSAYTWLGNQARADEGLVRWAVAAGMAHPSRRLGGPVGSRRRLPARSQPASGRLCRRRTGRSGAASTVPPWWSRHGSGMNVRPL